MSRFMQRRGARAVFSTVALAVACAASLIASSIESPAAQNARPDDKQVEHAGDLGTARARAVASARSLALSHPLAQARPQGPASLHSAKESPSGRERTADASHAEALFAAHSWYVAPPPPPPPAPVPSPPPEAPPFPYTFVGSYAPAGEQPVYFLARADRVIDAHVGDRLDGVYAFESAGPGNLVFNYLPLNIRQSVPTGVSP